MLRTITQGSYVSVQGVFERDLKNGQILVRVGERVYKGTPIGRPRAA